jgi:hypothetical protein
MLTATCRAVTGVSAAFCLTSGRISFERHNEKGGVIEIGRPTTILAITSAGSVRYLNSWGVVFVSLSDE